MSATAASAGIEDTYPAAGRGPLIFVLAMANFLQQLDQTIANVSLPTITSDLGAAPSEGAWIITSFAVANAIGVPLTGWLAARFGQVRVFTFAILLFGLASLACGLAWSMPVLIACRVAQGVGAGFMVPLSQALMLRAYPPGKQAVAITIWSMTTVLGPIVGPLLGGWITDHAHWSWIFLINIPVTLVCGFGVWVLLHDRDTATQKLPLDWVGMVLLVVWVGSLQLVLDKGNELDWFGSGFILALAIVVGLGFLLFLVWELTERHPLVDLSLFRERNFALGVFALGLMFSTMMALNLIATLWLQTELGYTAQWAGFVAAGTGMVMLVMGPFVGRYGGRFDPRILASFALFFMMLSAFYRAQFTSDLDFLNLVIPQLILGFGSSFMFVPMIGIIMGNIPARRLAAAASMQNFIRTMFGSFGTSLSVAIWERREALHHSQLADYANTFTLPGSNFAAMTHAMGLPPDEGWAIFDRILTVQTFTMAANDVSLVCGVLLLGVMALLWGTKPPFRQTSMAAVAE
jgi:DHA2 family multidrug resistance protein